MEDIILPARADTGREIDRTPFRDRLMSDGGKTFGLPGVLPNSSAKGHYWSFVLFKDCGVTCFIYVVLCEDTSSQLRDAHTGHCTSASEMKQKDVDSCDQETDSKTSETRRPDNKDGAATIARCRCGTPVPRSSSRAIGFRPVWPRGFNALPNMSKPDAMAARMLPRTSSPPATSATRHGTRQSTLRMP